MAARTSDDFGLDVGFRAEGAMVWMCLTWRYAKAVKEMSSERIICKTLPCQRGISKEYPTCFAIPLDKSLLNLYDRLGSIPGPCFGDPHKSKP